MLSILGSSGEASDNEKSAAKNDIQGRLTYATPAPETHNRRQQIKLASLTVFNVSSCCVEHPQALASCRTLLEVSAKRLGRPSASNDPVKQFGLQQIFLVAKEFLKKIDAQMICLTDFESSISNLVYFRRYRDSMMTPGTLYAFITQVQSLMCSIGEVVNLLERALSMEIRDWRECAEKLADAAVQADKGLSFRYNDYIPAIKDFECPELLGQGSHGNVYKVRHIPSSTYMAMKITRRSKFDGSSERGYIDKACAGLVSDPGMIKTHCAFMAKPDVYVILMNVNATREQLFHVITNEGFLSDRAVVMITMQLVLTIEYIHLNGFLHRDLNPSNVLIDRTCHIKLIDFDQAKVCAGHFAPKVIETYFKRTPNEFKDGERCGDTEYTAPEVLLKRSYGRASDWWSLGIVIYKLSTGRTPFRSSDPAALQKAIKTEQLCWPRTRHSAEMDTKEFVYDLLKKKPLSRLGSKIYSDVKFHKYMMRARHFLGTTTVPTESTFHDLVFSPIGEDTKFRLYRTKVLVDISRTLAHIASVRARRSKLVTQGNVTFAMLSDETTSEHKSLATFVNFKFRRLIDRLNEPGILKRVSDFLGADTPPHGELNYTAREDLESLWNETISYTTMTREAYQSKMSCFIPIGRHWRSLFIRREALVKLDLIEGDGGISFPVVRKVRFGKMAENKERILAGDIISGIASWSTMNQSLDAVMKYVDGIVSTAEGDSIPCEVFERGTFRVVIPESSAVFELLKCKPEVCVTITRDDKCRDFLTTRAVRVWDSAAGSFQTFHIVWWVAPDMRSAEGGSVFFGDLLIEVDSVACKNLDARQMRATLTNAGMTVRIVIVEASVLHRLDLVEAERPLPKLPKKKSKRSRKSSKEMKTESSSGESSSEALSVVALTKTSSTENESLYVKVGEEIKKNKTRSDSRENEPGKGTSQLLPNVNSSGSQISAAPGARGKNLVPAPIRAPRKRSVLESLKGSENPQSFLRSSRLSKISKKSGTPANKDNLQTIFSKILAGTRKGSALGESELKETQDRPSLFPVKTDSAPHGKSSPPLMKSTLSSERSLTPLLRSTIASECSAPLIPNTIAAEYTGPLIPSGIFPETGSSMQNSGFQGKRSQVHDASDMAVPIGSSGPVTPNARLSAKDTVCVASCQQDVKSVRKKPPGVTLVRPDVNGSGKDSSLIIPNIMGSEESFPPEVKSIIDSSQENNAQ